MNDDMAKAFASLGAGLTTLSGTVGTTATKVVSGTANAHGTTLVRLVNLSDNGMSFKVVAAGADAPTMTATDAATDGARLIKDSPEVIPLRRDVDLYIIASAVSSAYNLATW